MLHSLLWGHSRDYGLKSCIFVKIDLLIDSNISCQKKISMDVTKFHVAAERLKL